MRQIEATRKSIADLSAKLKITAELNGQLSKYFFREKSGYSIEALIRKIMDEDKYAQIIKTKEQYKNLLTQDGNKEKLEKAVLFLTNKKEENNTVTDSTLDFIVKAFPWLIGIYL